MSKLNILIEDLQRELSNSPLFSTLSDFSLMPVFNVNNRVAWFNSCYLYGGPSLKLDAIDCFSEEEGDSYQINNKLYFSREERKKIRRERKKTIRMLKEQNDFQKTTSQISLADGLKKSFLILILKSGTDEFEYPIKWIKKIVREMILFGEAFFD